jgi:hypothetical protein
MGMMGVDFLGAMMEGAHPIQVVAKRWKTVAGGRMNLRLVQWPPMSLSNSSRNPDVDDFIFLRMRPNGYPSKCSWLVE